MDVEDLVKSYFILGFSNKEILCLLAHQHRVIISKRTLQRLCRKLNLFRRKKSDRHWGNCLFCAVWDGDQWSMVTYACYSKRICCFSRDYEDGDQRNRPWRSWTSARSYVSSTSAGVPTRCGIMAYSETSSALKFNSYSTVFISLLGTIYFNLIITFFIYVEVSTVQCSCSNCVFTIF